MADLPPVPMPMALVTVAPVPMVLFVAIDRSPDVRPDEAFVVVDAVPLGDVTPEWDDLARRLDGLVIGESGDTDEERRRIMTMYERLEDFLCPYAADRVFGTSIQVPFGAVVARVVTTSFHG